MDARLLLHGGLGQARLGLVLGAVNQAVALLAPPVPPVRAGSAAVELSHRLRLLRPAQRRTSKTSVR